MNNNRLLNPISNLGIQLNQTDKRDVFLDKLICKLKFFTLEGERELSEVVKIILFGRELIILEQRCGFRKSNI